MATIAGMDLGYGSQVKIVKTNYLVVNADTSPTDQGAANLLHAFNRELQGGVTSSDTRVLPMTCDYIILDGNAPSTITSPNVIDGTSGSNIQVPLMGPSPSALHTVSGDGAGSHNNTTAAIGTSANGVILSILSASVCVAINNDGGSDIDGIAGVEINNLTTTMDPVNDLSNKLTIAQLTGAGLATINVYNLVAEAAGETLTAASLAGSTLNADFVMKGNASGTAETTLADCLADNVKMGIISITALVRTAQ